MIVSEFGTRNILSGTIAYLVPAVPVLMIALYVLFLRKHGSTGRMAGKGVKFFLGCIAAALLALSLIFIQIDSGTRPPDFLVQKPSSTSSSGWPAPYVEKVYFLQISPDEEALLLCRALAEKTKLEFGVAAEVVPHNAPLLRCNLMREKVFAVLSTEIPPPPPFKFSILIPDIVRRTFPRIFAHSIVSTAKPDTFWDRKRTRNGFRVFTPSTRYHLGYGIGPLQFADLMNNEMDITLAISSRGATREEIARKAAEESSKPVLDLLRPLRAPEAMRLPDFGGAIEEPPDFAGHRPILLGQGLSFGFFAIYRLDPKDMNTEATLAELGCVQESGIYSGGNVTYNGKNGLRACYSGKNTLTGTLAQPSTATLVLARERQLKSIPPAALECFKREELRSFVAAGGLGILKKEELSTFFDRAVALPITFAEKETILSRTATEDARKTLGERRTILFLTMIDEAYEKHDKEGFSRCVNALFRLASKMPETAQKKLKERMAPFLVPCVIPETADAEGRRNLDLDIPRKKLIGNPVILEISVPGFDAPLLMYPFSLAHAEDGTLREESGSGSGEHRGTRKSTVFYYKWRNWNFASQYFAPPALLQKNENPQLQVGIFPNMEKECFEIRLAFRPGEK